jgi:hypothetical protein
MNRKAKVNSNGLGSTVGCPMFREGIWYLLRVACCFFVTFFRFDLYLGKETCFREATESALTKLSRVHRQFFSG